ncbi:hypothetical protein [Streptomyces sp. NPDC059247]|uniref:hypothetical protein n=1 Tax=Streptomyces sp. NPDC059247 TaxID=3346790 RepID=UPI0036C5B20C
MPTPPRACTYCSNTEQQANACVRVQRAVDGGEHIYAHKVCAERAGKIPLYEFTNGSEEGR